MIALTRQDAQGQSMMEGIVAIAILMSAAIAISALAISSIRGGSFSRNEMLATQLAKESIEVARAFRDANALYNQAHPTNRRAWDAGLGIGEFSILEFRRNSYEQPELREPLWKLTAVANGGGCVNTGRCRLFWNPRHGLYTHEATDGIATSFYRFVQINEICDGHQVLAGGETCENLGKKKIGRQLISEVRWTEQKNSRQLRLEEHLYDWKF